MAFFYESEKREFVRVGVAVPVKFRLISQHPELTVPDDYLDGETQNIGAGGILLVGPIPRSDLVTELLVQKVVVGVRIFLPGEEKPVEALARVAWLEAIDEEQKQCSLGLAFKEITSEAQDTLFRFIISSRMG
ncbi:MAG TPA: PilZ domain-containing protein [Planctomycetota bacterium]|nr:PilZ domain-containing protein [Planctomycetota bacterium]